MPTELSALLVSVGLDMAPLLRGLSEAPRLAQAQLAAGMEQATRAATASVASAASQQTAAVTAGARAQAEVTAAAAAGQRREWDGLVFQFAASQKEMEAASRNRVAAENRQQRDETLFLRQQIAEQEAARRQQIASEERQWRDETLFIKQQLAEQSSAETAAAKAARDESSIPQRTTGANRRTLANQVGGALETAGVAGLAALGFAAEQAGKFQTVLTDMRTNTQMTDAEFDAFSKTTLDLGKTLGASTDKVADSFRIVKDFGFNTADSINIVTAATRSAVATNSDASVTTEFLAQTLHSFHDPASKAGEDMNLLHQAALKGHASMEQFVQSARDGFAIAGGFGQSLKDTAAVYATLTLNGFNAAEATTQLRNMLQHIANPGAAARAEIEKLARATGVDLAGDFTAAGLAARGLPAVLQDVERATAGNTAEAFKLINAQRGGFGAFLLAGKGAQDLRDIYANLSDVTGGKLDPITQGLAQRMGTLQNQVERMNNRFLELYTKVAPVVLPFLERLMKGIGDLLDRFNALDPGVQEGIVKVAAWGAAVSLAGGFVLKLVTGVKEFAEVVAGAKLLGGLAAVEKALAAPVAGGTVGAALLGGGTAKGAGAAAGGLSTAAGMAALGVTAAAGIIAAPVAMKLSANLAADQAQEAQARAQELTPILHALKPYEDELDTLRAKLKNFRYDDAQSLAANQAGLEHLRAEIANRSRELSQMAGSMLDGKPMAAAKAAGPDASDKALMAQALADDAAWDKEHAAAEKAQAAHHKRVEAEATRFHDAMAAARARLADATRGDASPLAKVAAEYPDLSAARRQQLVDLDAEIKHYQAAQAAHKKYADALGEVYAKIRDARQGPKSQTEQLKEKFPGASPAEIAGMAAAEGELRRLEKAQKDHAAAVARTRQEEKSLGDQMTKARADLAGAGVAERAYSVDLTASRIAADTFHKSLGTLSTAHQQQVRDLAAVKVQTQAVTDATQIQTEIQKKVGQATAKTREEALAYQLKGQAISTLPPVLQAAIRAESAYESGAEVTEQRNRDLTLSFLDAAQGVATFTQQHAIEQNQMAMTDALEKNNEKMRAMTDLYRVSIPLVSQEITLDQERAYALEHLGLRLQDVDAGTRSLIDQTILQDRETQALTASVEGLAGAYGGVVSEMQDVYAQQRQQLNLGGAPTPGASLSLPGAGTKFDNGFVMPDISAEQKILSQRDSISPNQYLSDWGNYLSEVERQVSEAQNWKPGMVGAGMGSTLGGGALWDSPALHPTAPAGGVTGPRTPAGAMGGVGTSGGPTTVSAPFTFNNYGPINGVADLQAAAQGMGDMAARSLSSL